MESKNPVGSTIKFLKEKTQKFLKALSEFLARFSTGTILAAILILVLFIVVVTPAHAVGSVNVTVTNPDNQTATLSNGFTYLTTVNAGSSITAFPTSVAGDGTTASRITVTLLNTDSSPAAGHNVTVFRTAGPGTEVITPVVCASGFAPAGTTNPLGEACFDVTSTNVGIHTFGATDTTDNITLTSTVNIEFTCAVGTSGGGTTTGEQCATIGITPQTGSLSITHLPDSFSFPASVPGGDTFNNETGPDDGDRITVSDTRGSAGFTLQLQATTDFADTTNPLLVIPLTKLYTATSAIPDGTRDANGIACSGIQYLGPAYDSLPDCSTLTDPVTAQFNILGGYGNAASYTGLTGNTLNATVDLMQTSAAHNASFSQFVNYRLHIPQTQEIGNYQFTLTFTAL